MNNEQTVVKGNIGFFGALQIVFIVLKLCSVIDWNWWLVLLPALIWLGLKFLIAICYIIHECLEG